jgi:hypothetical protein
MQYGCQKSLYDRLIYGFVATHRPTQKGGAEMSSATTDVTALRAPRVCGPASTTRFADHMRARPDAGEH